MKKQHSKFKGVTKDTNIFFDSGISVRCLNIIKGNYDKLNIDGDSKVSDLANFGIIDFYKIPGAGRKTCNEIRELCFFADVKLKQGIDFYPCFRDDDYTKEV